MASSTVDPGSEKKGFMVGLNIGYLLPNDEPATFYDGTPWTRRSWTRTSTWTCGSSATR